jgi:AraC-like DNA-binding protein
MPNRPASVTAPVDRLSTLFERFRVRAHLFHAGPLCGLTRFAAEPGRGFLHVLQRGELRLRHHAGSALPRTRTITEPTLIFCPRPLAHDFRTAATDGSDFVCATLDFEGGDAHPLARALPPLVLLPLARLPERQHTLALLFAETEQLRCGRRLLADRLFEVLLLQLLRWLLDHPTEAPLPPGLLAGLADERLAQALVAVHDEPGAPWTLESMAARAGLSRSAFAARFKQVLGLGPAEYLAHWRVALAMGLLREGVSIKAAAARLGYAGPSSLSRVFTQVAGRAPREWLREQTAA